MKVRGAKAEGRSLMEVRSTDKEQEAEAQGGRPQITVSRRGFVQVLGTGLLVSLAAPAVLGQSRGGGRGGPAPVSARIHLGDDGTITVLSGKIEMGQGARTELAQAAAEELRVPFDRVQMILADTSIVPDDGLSAGSRTTPQTVPAVRQAAAAARKLLIELAARKWNVSPEAIQVRDGKISDPQSQRTFTYADLARSGEAEQALKQSAPSGVAVTPVKEWQVMGESISRPNRKEIVTGAHKYPSDYARPGMLYGKVLRAPSYGAKLLSVDLGPAKAMEGVLAFREGEFVGVAAPNTWRAKAALQAVAGTAKWEPTPHPSSRDVFKYLRERARGGVPDNPFPEELDKAAKKLKATYEIAYVQHAPMETRTALAEWADGKLTVWTGTQNPFGYHNELVRAFNLPTSAVRVVVPDFGGGFGGKHTGEAAIEAARLAKAFGKPVLVRWTREEEFTWAYFRPAAVIDAEATLDDNRKLTSWHFVNINSGGSAIDTPYRAGNARSRFVQSDTPLRQGSYRVLAATANNFARECFMDELAAAAGADPLDFRLAHLEHPRLRAVLEAAAERFQWRERIKTKTPGTGFGIACGTEKGSYVAACVEIGSNASQDQFTVRKITEVFECGAVVNPDNLMAQIQGCMIMALGPALREEMRFAEGEMRNAAFSKYAVPRFNDVPELDVHVLNRTDLDSAGAGETPIIPVAPAIANAVFHATGRRIRQMPIRL